jgi:tRNA-dihydrouridine synthase B
MAGITDLPFRALCKKMGAGLTTSEMLSSDISLWDSVKSKHRLATNKEASPRSIQLAGSIPEIMAEAARQNVVLGAEIIDINMGCPAKKVLKRAAGSALLKDEKLVEEILKSVTSAVDIPVTLKIRTGWSTKNRNAISIARIAEDAGIKALAVHGRTRECRFLGNAEYDTIASVVESCSIPIFANGDISSPQDAKHVLDYTGAAAVMVGRAAQGNPWIFEQINHYLEKGFASKSPSQIQIANTVTGHIKAIHKHYGEHLGTKIARKHVGWYINVLAGCKEFRSHFFKLEKPEKQLKSLHDFFGSTNNIWNRAA